MEASPQVLEAGALGHPHRAQHSFWAGKFFQPVLGIWGQGRRAPELRGYHFKQLTFTVEGLLRLRTPGNQVLNC